MRKLVSLCACCSFFLVLSCNNSSDADKTTGGTSMVKNQVFDAGKARTDLETTNQQFTDAFERGDTVALAGYYSTDGMVMPPNSEGVRKEGIGSLWGNFTRMGIKDFNLTIQEVIGSGDLMVESGNYELLGNDNKSLDKGKYVVVWKKENGSWKIYRDIFNTDLPPTK
jgi:ketosteroid isomerase-like protein